MRGFRIEQMRGRSKHVAYCTAPDGTAYAIRVFARGVLPRWRVDVYNQKVLTDNTVPLATGHYTNAATVERVVSYFIGLIEDGRMA